MTTQHRTRNANRLEVGRLIRKLIKSVEARQEWTRGRTVEYVGHSVAFGVDAVHSWMNGRNLPDCETLKRLARIGVDKASLDKRWVDQLLLHGACPDRATTINQLFPEVSSMVKHNLPHLPYPMLGRETLQTQIIKLLAPDSRDWIIPIEGIGGVGKTALAGAVAWHFVDAYDRMPSYQHFSTIIWVSAKRDELTARGIQPTKPTLTNLEDIYDAIADVLGTPQILQVSGERKRRAAMNALRDAGRVLLVVDNLEAVDDPAFAEVLDFLRQLPSQAKAIATTREHEDLPFPIRLDVLDRDAAYALISQECATRDVELADSQIEDLIDATGRLPLALWWAVGLMSLEGYSIETALRRLTDQQDDLLRYIFGTAVTGLKSSAPDSYRALLALSFFDTDTGATLHALANILHIEDEACRTAVYRLLNLNLANRVAGEGRFRLLPLTRAYALTEAQADPVQEQEARKRWIAFYLRFFKPAEDRRDFGLLPPEIGNLWELMDWLVIHNRMDDLAMVYQRVHAFLYAEGHHWDRLLKYANEIAEWAVKEEKANIVGLTLHAPVDIFRKRMDNQRGEMWLERAKLAAMQFDDELLRADVLLCQGRLWDRYRGLTIEKEAAALTVEIEQTLSELQKALEIYQRLQPTQAVQVLNALGNLYRWTREFNQAIQFYEEGLHVLEAFPSDASYGRRSTNGEHWRAILKGNLALVAGAQERFDEARDGLFEILPELHDLIDQAEVYAALALYASKQGHEDDEDVYRARVDRIKAELGIMRSICIEDEEWEQLHKSKVENPTREESLNEDSAQ